MQILTKISGGVTLGIQHFGMMLKHLDRQKQSLTKISKVTPDQINSSFIIVLVTGILKSSLRNYPLWHRMAAFQVQSHVF